MNPRTLGAAPLRNVGLVAAVALALTACGGYTEPNPEDAQYGVCTDQRTGNRLDDDACGDDWDDDSHIPGGTYIMWFPGNYGGTIPPVGQRVEGGTKVRPSGPGVVRSRGIPSTGIAKSATGGGIAQRGGLGVSSAGSKSGGGSGGGGGKSGGS